jgi:hypothetical protein
VARAPTPHPSPATGGAADYLIGAGIVLAQAWYAAKSYSFLRRTRRTA